MRAGCDPSVLEARFGGGKLGGGVVRSGRMISRSRRLVGIVADKGFDGFASGKGCLCAPDNGRNETPLDEVIVDWS